MLKQKAFHATLWSAVEKFGANGLTTVFMIALARLLTPEDFGLFASVSLVVLFASRAALVGIDEVIIKCPDLSNQDFETAVWLCAGIATVLALGVALLGPMVAGEGISMLLPLAAPMIVFNSCSYVITGRLRRDLKINKLAMRTLICNFVGGSVAVPLAFWGYGVYALLAQQFIASLLSMIMLCGLSGFRPAWRFGLVTAHGLLISGWPMLGHVLLTQFNRESPRLFVGLFLGVEALGIMSITMRFMYTAFALTGNTIQTVCLPVMAEVNRTPGRIGPVYLRLCRIIFSVVLPMFLFVAIFGEPIVRVLLGQQWLAAIPLIWPIFLSAIPMVMNIASGSTLVALDKARIQLGFSVFVAVVGSALLTAAAPFGLLAMAWAVLLRAVIAEPPQMIHVLCRVEVPIVDFLEILKWPLLGGASMLIAGWGLLRLMAGLPDILQCIVGAVVVPGVYVVVLLVFDRGLISELRGLVARKRAPKAVKGSDL